ncbi:MAG: ribosome maturation factor RimP [Ignavibacteriales bacterium]|nr:ribosome maturation factor RimP [Ignavibacteriales bacterium]
MSEIKEKITNLAQGVLEGKEIFLVDITIRGERGSKVAQVYVDTDKGITIEECAQISRELGTVIDEMRVFQGAYHLEVSSPGIDKPLRLLRQYPKNIGRPFKVTYREHEASNSFIGKLTAIAEDRLTFTPTKGEPKTIAFSQIIESKEELPW